MWVDGVPETKGSWIPLGGGRVKADNPRERGWANAIAWSAKLQVRGRKPGLERISVTMVFHLPPPPNKTKKNRRDVDKMVRSVLDALSGIAYADDEQVDRIEATKVVVLDGKVGVQVEVSVWSTPSGKGDRNLVCRGT
jgi:crossover junction endodeoxyribonuclease RusA